MEGELRSPEAVREKLMCDFVSHQRRHDIITQTRTHARARARARTHTHTHTQAVFFLRISKLQSVGCSHEKERRRCLIWCLKQNKAKHKLIQLGHLSHHQKGGEVVLPLPASTPTPLAEFRSFLYSSDLARAYVLSWFYLSTNWSAPSDEARWHKESNMIFPESHHTQGGPSLNIAFGRHTLFKSDCKRNPHSPPGFQTSGKMT